MRKFHMKKKIGVAVAAGALTVTVAGGAFAYWTTTGSGAGSATTGTSSPFAVTTDAATGTLAPGGPTQTVAFHVKNNNSGVQRLSAVAVTVATSTGAAWASVPGCSAADYSVGTPTFTAGDVAPGATVDGTVTITMNNLSTPQDACKGATVPLYVATS